jgi:hypothetical protein
LCYEIGKTILFLLCHLKCHIFHESQRVQSCYCVDDQRTMFGFPKLVGGGGGKTLLSLHKALGPTQPPIKCLVGASMPGIRGWGIMLTIQTMLQVEKDKR